MSQKQPPKPLPAATQIHTHIVLDRELWEQLRIAAALEHVPAVEIIRRTLRDYISANLARHGSRSRRRANP